MVKEWQTDQDPIESEDDFLCGLEYEEVGDPQRMLWHAVKIQVKLSDRDPVTTDGAYRFWCNTDDERLFIRIGGVPPNTVWWELKVK